MPNFNITINTPQNLVADKSAEAENFYIRALSFERNEQFEEAEYYYNRALDADVSLQEAKVGLRRVQSIIIQDNVLIQRGKPLSTGEGRVSIILDGKKLDYISPNSSVRIKVPVGTHTLQFKRASIKSDTIPLLIETNKTVFEIAVETKAFSIKTSVKQYRRHEILH
jgi:hypothetical protein